MEELRLIVCGCRDWPSCDRGYAIVRGNIDRVWERSGHLAILAHGDAPGADRLAQKAVPWATPYPADWNGYGRRAGPMRNQRMLDEVKPNLVLAFWDGHSAGTLDMIRRATKAGVRVEIIPRPKGL